MLHIACFYKAVQSHEPHKIILNFDPVAFCQSVTCSHILPSVVKRTLEACSEMHTVFLL